MLKTLKEVDFMEEKVKKVIEELRKYLQADGGDVELVKVDEKTGQVQVRLTGACHGCPMAAMTLTNGVEARLKEQVPGVTSVVAV
jgi:Fe-S cluster biogenesis protein NfuA